MRCLIPIAVAASLLAQPCHAQDESIWRGCGKFEAWRIWVLGTEDFDDEAATAECGAPKEPEELLVGCTRVIGRSADKGILGDADFNRALAHRA